MHRAPESELLDVQARAAYQQRIDEITGELATSSAWNDLSHAEALRTELERLQDELARCLGLGGKSRKFASQAERARVNVQRRLRDVTRRVAEIDPALARHLERSVRTGTFCAYDPE